MYVVVGCAPGASWSVGCFFACGRLSGRGATIVQNARYYDVVLAIMHCFVPYVRVACVWGAAPGRGLCASSVLPSALLSYIISPGPGPGVLYNTILIVRG